MKELLPSDQIRFLEEIKKLPFNEGILFLFTLETGVRLNEALALTVEDVRSRQSVIVRSLKKRNGKNENQFREIPISSALKPFLEKYLTVYDKFNNPAFNPNRKIFISGKRRPMSARYAQHVFLSVMKKLGLTRQVTLKNGRVRYYGIHFHSLRHTFARNLVRRNVSLPIIQRLLGHTNLNSTGIYLQPTREELFQAIA